MTADQLQAVQALVNAWNARARQANRRAHAERNAAQLELLRAEAANQDHMRGQ